MIMYFLKTLWACKNNIAAAWIFFFALSFVGESPYGTFTLFLISGIFAILLTLAAIPAKKS